MIKLSDYLDYLNNEIIRARKKADEAAIKVAKEYAKHEYLKYFKVPRYAMPSVKMDIPIKIADIQQESKYNFKVDPAAFIQEVNEKIALVNRQKKLQIRPLSENQLTDDTFRLIFRKLEDQDRRFGKLPLTEIRKMDITGKIRNLNLHLFNEAAVRGAEDQEDLELSRIFTETLLSKYTLVDSKLQNLFIDPNTMAAEDKGKLFINLHVEMEEEGIRLVVLQDENGNNIEQITFE